MINLFDTEFWKTPTLDVQHQDEDTPLERVTVTLEDGEIWEIFKGGTIINWTDRPNTYYPEEIAYLTGKDPKENPETMVDLVMDILWDGDWSQDLFMEIMGEN